MDTPARSSSLRARNLASALEVVLAASEPPSRARLADATGLTRATASVLADALLVAGLLAELPPATRARTGRPSAGLVLSGRSPVGVGLAVEVDGLTACAVDLAGRVVVEQAEPGDARSVPPDEVLRRAAGLAVRVAAAADRPVAGLTVGVPGLVDRSGSRVLTAPNLGWSDLDVAGLVAVGGTLEGVPVSVANEADLAALAEQRHTAGDFLCLSGHVGIGAGVVLGGRPHRGAHGWSGEVGHLTVDRRGPRCGCGARGCLEQYAGSEAVAVRAGLPGASPERVAEAAAGGDRRARSALSRAGSALGVVVAGVVNLLDLDAVLLGGALAPLAPWMVPAVELELGAHVLWAQVGLPEVRAARAGRSATAVGAATASLAALRAAPLAGLAAGPSGA